MSPEILVFSFGAISSGAVALVFVFKWVLDGRRFFDLAWAGALLSYAVGVGCLTYKLATGITAAGYAATALYWTFAALMVMANLDFAGRAVPRFAIAVSAAIVAGISLS